MKVKSLSHVLLFATLWTVASQAPPSMGFSRQEYWSGLGLPSPGEALYSQQKQDLELTVAQMVKCLPTMWETLQSLGWEDPLEKEMATYSSTLA